MCENNDQNKEEKTDTNETVVNKKIGGVKRACQAREELLKIYNDPGHPEHLEKDIYFARKYDVIRHTIYKIRHDNKIPPRSKRILGVLKSLNTKELTMNDLTEKLHLKYQNLYKIMKDNNLPFKSL